METVTSYIIYHTKLANNTQIEVPYNSPVLEMKHSVWGHVVSYRRNNIFYSLQLKSCSNHFGVVAQFKCCKAVTFK